MSKGYKKTVALALLFVIAAMPIR